MLSLYKNGGYVILLSNNFNLYNLMVSTLLLLSTNFYFIEYNFNEHQFYLYNLI